MSVRPTARLHGAAVFAAFALVLSGCGGSDDPDAAPGPAPVVTGAVETGTAGVDPFVEPTCRAPRTAADRDHPEVERAAAEIRKIGAKAFADRFAGVSPCVPDKRVVVFRVRKPGTDFRTALQRVGRKYRVSVDVQDASFTRKQAQATRRAVLGRFAELDTAGAPFAVLRIHENATVEVAVRANVAAAEKVLADLLDRIYVVLIPEPPATAAPTQAPA